MPDARLSFEAVLKADNYLAGLSKISSASSATAKNIESSFSKIKLDKIPGLGDLGATAGKSAIKGIADDFSSLKIGASATASSLRGSWNKASDSLVASTDKARNSLKSFADASHGFVQDSPRLRYALYDVSSTTGAISASFLSAATAVTVLSAKYESAFTNVERTTMANTAQLKDLRMQLEGLARDIPLAFSDITNIAALGAQLGVAKGDLAGFTEVVAQFAATTNVSTESAAQSFGAIGELLDISANEFVNLGSAIAFAGVNSVATETEILSVTTAISAVAKQAGLTNNYIGGLATALASLRVPAEQSRGALTRTFQEINRAAADGGQSLNNFATVVGMSAKDVQALLSQEGGVDKFFNLFITNLGRLNPQQLTSTLDALNLSDIRVTNTLTRLSQNLDVVGKSVDNFTTGYENGSFLAAAYAKRVEDLAAKFQILQNSLAELGAKIGDSLGPLVGGILDAISQSVQNLSDAMGTEAGQNAAKMALAFTAVAGALTGLITVVGVASAGLSAYKTVVSTLGLASATGGLRGMAAGFLGVAGASGAAAASMRIFRLALISTGVGAAIVALGSLMEAFQQAGDSSEIQFNKYVGSTSGLLDAVQKDSTAYVAAVTAGNTAVADSYTLVNRAVDTNEKKFDSQTQTAVNAAKVLGSDITKAMNSATTAAQNNTVAIGSNTVAWFRNQLMQNEAFRGLIGNDEFLKQWLQMGLNFNDAVAIAAVDGEQGVLNYFQAQANATRTGTSAVVDQWMSFWGFMSKLGKVQLIDLINGNVDLAQMWNDSFAGVGNVVLSDAQKTAAKTIGGLGNAVQLFGFDAADASKNAAGLDDNIDSLGNNSSKAANKIRTLVDYASDLSSVWSRAFEIRFSGAQTFDKIISTFSNLRQSIAAAREEIDNASKSIRDINNDINSLNADIQSLTADKALQEYFLTIANGYGDTARAQQIAARIAELDAELAKKSEDLADKNLELAATNTKLNAAQQKTNKTLVGSSDIAVQNRSDILDLVQSYQEHIRALAQSGMSQDQLAITTEQLRQDFIAQATQMGYNINELGIYSAAFDDVTLAINRVPRNLTVTADVNPAITAFNEMVAKANESGSSAGSKISSGISSGVNSATSSINGLKSALNGIPTNLQTNVKVNASSDGGGGNWDGKLSSLVTFIPVVGAWLGMLLRGAGWADGGYTGAGGKYDVAGVVHRGEYVIPKEQVNQSTGMPYYMSQPRSFAQGGFVGGAATSAGVTMVELSPYDRKLLAAAGNVQLRLDGKVVAQATNVNNIVSAQRGTN